MLKGKDFFICRFLIHKTMKKIVVAVDFSAHTTKITEFALNLAMLNKVEILLFHTVIKHFYFLSQHP